MRLPPRLAAEWHTRGFYGTLSHNVKAIYQRYLGWFDGNPAHLHGLPPREVGRRYVDFAGGSTRLLDKARLAYAAGDYRWVVEIVDHLLSAEPGHTEAKALQAGALEQLGYQSESGPWRAFYLTGSQELRGALATAAPTADRASGEAASLPIKSLLHLLAVRVHGVLAADEDLSLDLVVEGDEERYGLRLANGVLHQGPAIGDVSVTLSRRSLLRLVADVGVADELLRENAVQGSGREVFKRLASYLENPPGSFPLTQPNPEFAGA